MAPRRTPGRHDRRRRRPVVMRRGRAARARTARPRRRSWSAGQPACRRIATGLQVDRRDGCARVVVAGLDDPEQRVELRELEEAAQVLIEVRERQLAALCTYLLGDRDEDAESGAVDVAGAGEVDEELPLALVELPNHGVTQVLAS